MRCESWKFEGLRIPIAKNRKYVGNYLLRWFKNTVDQFTRLKIILRNSLEWPFLQQIDYELINLPLSFYYAIKLLIIPQGVTETLDNHQHQREIEIYIYPIYKHFFVWFRRSQKIVPRSHGWSKRTASK